MALNTALSARSCILEPATMLATFCSSMTFQLMKASMSGWSASTMTILAARRVVPPGLDGARRAVADLEEAHEARGLAAARQLLPFPAQVREVGARARSRT
jgi:hypothetical protein